MESVAAFAWNGWQASRGISGRLDLEYAYELLNRFVLHLNRRLYKRRFEKGEMYLEGIVVCEPTPELYTIHYHVLILLTRRLTISVTRHNGSSHGESISSHVLVSSAASACVTLLFS